MWNETKPFSLNLQLQPRWLNYTFGVAEAFGLVVWSSSRLPAPGIFAQWPGIMQIYPACLIEPGPGWGDYILSSVEITWNSPCSSKDTEIKEATCGLAEKRTLLLAILASFIFYVPKIDWSKKHSFLNNLKHIDIYFEHQTFHFFSFY